MSVISISIVKKVNCTKFEQNPFENKQFEIFGISGTPDLRSTFGKIDFTASRVPESTCLKEIISFFVSNLSFSVEKSKISQLRPKLWPPEVEVKIFLELQSVKIVKKINFLCNFH